MSARNGPPEVAASPLVNLRRALAGDRLLEPLASAAGAAGKPPAFLCGLYVADALSGLPPRGILVAYGGDTAAASRFFASATGRLEVGLKGRKGVYSLVPRTPGPDSARSVTVVPLEGGGIEEHLRRGGFTAAAMAVGLTGSSPSGLIDPFGGREDLERARLGAVPGSRLAADPARALCAVELCHRYGLEMEEETVADIREASGGLAGLPPARVWAAVARLSAGGGLSEKASALRRTGVLGALVPELEAVFDVPQNYYHHLGVWEHTLETLDNLERMLEEPTRFFTAYGSRVAAHLKAPVEGGVDRRAFLGFAALVHDIGKAATMTVEPSGRIRFQGHQREGARLARGVAGRLGLGRRGRRRLVGLVGQHMRLGFLLKEGESTECRLRTIDELGNLSIEVAMLSLADRLATRGEASTGEALERYRRMVNRMIADYFWNRDCPKLAHGRDVLLHAGVAPGPEVARRLFAVRVAQREAMVSSRQQALEFMAPDFKGKMR